MFLFTKLRNSACSVCNVNNQADCWSRQRLLDDISTIFAGSSTSGDIMKAFLFCLLKASLESLLMKSWLKQQFCWLTDDWRKTGVKSASALIYWLDILKSSTVIHRNYSLDFSTSCGSWQVKNKKTDSKHSCSVWTGWISESITCVKCLIHWLLI